MCKIKIFLNPSKLKGGSGRKRWCDCGISRCSSTRSPGWTPGSRFCLGKAFPSLAVRVPRGDTALLLLLLLWRCVDAASRSQQAQGNPGPGGPAEVRSGPRSWGRRLLCPDRTHYLILIFIQSPQPASSMILFIEKMILLFIFLYYYECIFLPLKSPIPVDSAAIVSPISYIISYQAGFLRGSPLKLCNQLVAAH